MFSIIDIEDVIPSTYKLLLIGDPHFKTDNLEHIDQFTSQVMDTCTRHAIDLVVIMGDLLHYHERVNTSSLNKAYMFIQTIRKQTPIYIIVGNHDYINNSQFLTDNHWMNALKEWSNVVVVDRVVTLPTPHGNVVFCPYVFPGRFEEALNTVDWKHAHLILAHQEIYGCKMGALQSVEGDKWDVNYPMVCSGHIHDRQLVQPNVFYVGSAMQHAFGESSDKSLSIVHLDTLCIQNIRLSLPKKKTYYVEASTLLAVRDTADLHLDYDTYDKIRITLQGTAEEFKVIKKTKMYKDLSDKNVKIVFRTVTQTPVVNARVDHFSSILYRLLQTAPPAIRPELHELYVVLVSSLN